MAEATIPETKATHTAGPWTRNVLVVTDAEGGTICHCTRWEGRQHQTPKPETAEANACLIAAAPELLAALTNLERAIDGFSRGEDFYVRDHGLALTLARAEATAAVAKAEGRS